MNIQDVGQLVFVFVLLVVRCKATFSNHSYKTSGFGFFPNLGCHSFLNPSITYLAHQIQWFKWGFPVTRHQSSVNFHILILNFPSITTRTILDVSSIWAQLKSYLRWYCAVVLPEVTWPEVTSVTCLVRKYILRMRNRKLRHIRPSGACWPDVTKSRDRKYVLRMPGFSPRFFLVVVTWLPKVPWVYATEFAQHP